MVKGNRICCGIFCKIVILYFFKCFGKWIVDGKFFFIEGYVVGEVNVLKVVFRVVFDVVYFGVIIF